MIIVSVGYNPDYKLTNDTPKLTLMSDLSSVFCEYSEENLSIFCLL